MSTNVGPVDRREDVRVSQQPGVEKREVVTEDLIPENARRLNASLL